MEGQRHAVTSADGTRIGLLTAGDGPYDISREFEDVAAVATSLGGPVDVFGHSIGATCALGAAAMGAPVRRLALYEPPGPAAVPAPWRDRALAMIADGRPGPAMASFLIEIIGLSTARIDELRNAPRDYDALAVVSATMPREARALATADLKALAADVSVPVLLILGSASPAWVHDITGDLAAVLPQSTLAVLDGQGHEATDIAPDLLASRLAGFFSY